MPDPIVIPRYGRWSREFEPALCPDTVRVLSPGGKIFSRPVFDHQPAQFHYDQHGYEEIIPSGEPVKAVRFTPQETGDYHYEALANTNVVERGVFRCAPSDHPGYITLSLKDPRYFACSNGESFSATGVNLCAPSMYALPRGMEHFEVGSHQATLGLSEYRRWFRLLSENGGTFTRIWLSGSYLQAETEVAGEVAPLIFNRLDGVVEVARQYGIRLKLCFDHFRAFVSDNPVTQAFFLRKLRDPDDGHSPETMDEWMQDPRWQELWFKKAQAYLARYGGDPVVMAWELWNEMDCVETDRFELVREWTRTMLTRIKQVEPDQLVVNSLGSFDDENKIHVQEDFKMDEMDFQQVHRYLDQGASWAICNLDPVGFSVDAVQRARRPDRPVLLAETGAVNDRHTGPFRYFRMDQRGMIFHDTTFPAFFAGAAGTGQDWWWDSYVDQKDVWEQFRPFADLIKDVALDQENFTALDFSLPEAWCLDLKGRHTLLAWVRNKADTWDRVLRDGQEAPILARLRFDFGLPLPMVTGLVFYPLWPDAETKLDVRLGDGDVLVEQMKYGLMIRLSY